MIYVKKEISRIASTVLFEPNLEVTWAAFTAQAEALLNSVKEVKKGGNPAMEIKEYGFLQQSGFTAGGRYAGATVPPRRFMPLTAASKKGKVHADQRMRKAMSKHEGRLIKRWKSVIRTPWKTISK